LEWIAHEIDDVRRVQADRRCHSGRRRQSHVLLAQMSPYLGPWRSRPGQSLSEIAARRVVIRTPTVDGNRDRAGGCRCRSPDPGAADFREVELLVEDKQENAHRRVKSLRIGGLEQVGHTARIPGESVYIRPWIGEITGLPGGGGVDLID